MIQAGMNRLWLVVVLLSFAAAEYGRAQSLEELLGVDDPSVDLEIDGRWTATLGGSLGWLLDDGDEEAIGSSVIDIPGIDDVGIFDNSIDLTVSFWLMERFSLRARIIDIADITILEEMLAEYRGADNEPLRSLRAGYGVFDIEPVANLGMARGNGPSIGLYALLASDISRHQLFVGYEESAPERRRFLGLNRVRGQSIEVSDYIRGRFFILPDRNISRLRLYLESPDGRVASDGRRYREVDIDDYASYSLSDGSIAFDSPLRRSALVYYRKGGVSAGDDRLGKRAVYRSVGGAVDVAGGRVDFSFSRFPDSRLHVDNIDAIVLYRPGQFSPFEMTNRYGLDMAGVDPQTLDGDDVSLIDRYDNRPIESLSLTFEISPDYDFLIVSGDALDLRSAGHRYPFASGAFDFPRLYGDNALIESESYVDFYIDIASTQPADQLRAGDGAIDDTVSVIANGVPNPRAAVDPATGAIVIDRPIVPTDRIDIFYRSAGEGNGSILFGNSNRFAIADHLFADIGVGGSWPITAKTYSSKLDEHFGAFRVAGALRWEPPNASIALSGVAQLTVPDSVGVLRLSGMEDGETIVALDTSALLPGAPPTASDQGGDVLPALRADSRGELFYRNHVDVDDDGARRLLRYDDRIDDARRYDYIDGAPIGPYLVATGDETDGDAMAMTFAIGRDQWVAGQIAVSGGDEIDLSAAEELEFLWKSPNIDIARAVDSIDVRLQIGATAEDLDADGNLERGASPQRPWFSFDHNDISFRAGFPVALIYNHIYDEDGNGNNLLDIDEPARIYTSDNMAEIPNESAGNGWRRAKILLSPADRARLRNARSIRVVIRSIDGASEGTIIFADFVFRGAGSFISGNSGRVSARSFPDRPSKGIPTLLDQFEEARSVFHPAGERQRALKIEWGGATGDEPAMSGDPRWRLVDSVEPAHAGDYRFLAFYLRVERISADRSPVLSITMTNRPTPDSEGETAPGDLRGIAAAIPLPIDGDGASGGRWRKIAIDSSNGTLFIDGKQSNSAALPASMRGIGAPRRGDRLRYLTVQMDGSDSGVILLDELHWLEAPARLDGSAELSARWRYDGTIASIGQFPLIANLSAAQYLNVASAGVDAGAGQYPLGDRASSRSEIGADLFGARFDLYLDIDSNLIDSPFVGAGHTIVIPAIPFPLSFHDIYRKSYNRPDETLYRSSEVRLEFPEAGSWSVSADGRARDGRLRQRWRASQLALWEFPVRFDWSIAAGQETDYAIDRASIYPASWIADFALVAPTPPTNTISRDAIGDLRLSLAIDESIIWWEILASYRNNSATLERQYNRATAELGAELLFGDSVAPWIVEPYYRRSLATAFRIDSSADFGSDITGYFDKLPDTIYAAIPIVELFDPALAEQAAKATASLADANYTAVAGARLTAPRLETLAALIIPQTFSASLQRTITRDDDRVEDQSILTTAVGWSFIEENADSGEPPGINFRPRDIFRAEAFGLSGAGFSSDGALLLSVDIPRNDDDAIAWRIGYFASAQFALSEGIGLRLDGEIDVEQPNAALPLSDQDDLFDGDSRLRLSLLGAASITWLTLLPEDIRVDHNERFEFSIEPSYGGIDENIYIIVIGHESSLQVIKFGHIGLFFDASLSFQPHLQDAVENTRAIFGIQAGIRGTLQF